MNSTEPHSPNLLCSLQPFTGTQRWLESSPLWPPAPSGHSPFLLPTCGLTQICFFLGGPVSWSDSVNTGARKTWAGALPSGASSHSQVGEGFVPFFFFLNQQKQDQKKKMKSRGERATLLFTAPKSGVGWWCGSKRGGGQAPRGCPAGAFRPPGESAVRLKELASAAVPWVLSFPRTHLHPHLEGLFRFTSLFVFLYMRVHVHVYLCLCRWVCCWAWVRAYTYISVCVSLCVCVCMCVRGSGRKGARR